MCRVSFWHPPNIHTASLSLSHFKDRKREKPALTYPFPDSAPVRHRQLAQTPLMVAAPWCAGLLSHLRHWAAHKAPRPGARCKCQTQAGLGAGYPQSARPFERLPVPKVVQGCSCAAFVLAANPLLCVLLGLLEQFHLRNQGIKINSAASWFDIACLNLHIFQSVPPYKQRECDFLLKLVSCR